MEQGESERIGMPCTWAIFTIVIPTYVRRISLSLPFRVLAYMVQNCFENLWQHSCEAAFIIFMRKARQ
jgi:hypothetical protein